MGGTMGGMEKTTVYLTAEQKQALADAARAEGRSEARLIREGIDGVLAQREAHRAGETVPPLDDATREAAEVEETVPERPRWIRRGEFVRRFGALQADGGLREELRALAPDTTDDIADL